MSYFKNFDRSLLHERWFALLFLCLPLFFLTVKSWSSGVGILLFLSVLLLISRAPSKSINKNSKVVWINSLVLITPLLCETVATIGRRIFFNDPPYFPAFDTASRFLIASSVYFYLSNRSKNELFPALGLGAFLSLIFLVTTLLLHEDYFWGGHRAATSLVDPNTLGCYVMALGGLAYFWSPENCSKIERFSIKLTAVLCSCGVAYSTYSRSAFLATAVFIFIIFCYETVGRLRLRIITLFLLSVAFISILLSGTEAWRIHEIARDLEFFFRREAVETSIGARIELLLIDLELFRIYPFFGIKDGALPPFDVLSSKSSWISPIAYEVKSNTGSHTEYTAWLVKQGLWGLLSLYAIFIYPLFYFLRRRKSQIKTVSSTAWAGLSFIMIVMVGSLGVQLLNLKLGVTFFSLVVAALFLDLNRVHSGGSFIKD